VCVCASAVKSTLRNRVMLHSAHRVGDQAAKVRCLKALDNSVADQLSAAALKFSERDFHDAINIYKQIVIKNRSIYSEFSERCWFTNIHRVNHGRVTAAMHNNASDYRANGRERTRVRVRVMGPI